jgi:transposase-like protein
MDVLMYSDNFKMNIAMEVLREEQSLVAIAKKYNLEPFLVRRWKFMFIDLVENTLKSKNSEINYLKNELNKHTNYDNYYNNILPLLK